jgi:hypothetical protein
MSEQGNMFERDWGGELEQWLKKKFAESCEAIGQRTPLSGVRISPPVGAEEAKYFVLGLEEGLFGLDEEGNVQSELFVSPASATTEPQRYRIFSSEPPVPRLLRENVCQLATVSLLIFKRGWLKRHVALEPSSKEHRSAAHGVDLLVRSTSGRILIWVEVKRSAVELQKLIADLRACSRRGAHALGDCGFPQNHPRYEFCLSSQPAYLWAVAPDAEICFEIKCEHSSIDLEQLTSLPPRSLIELE